MACNCANQAGFVREGPSMPVVIKYDYTAGNPVTIEQPVDVLVAHDIPMGEQGILFATGVASATGDNLLIAAPGVGQQIIITAIHIQNESSNSTTAILKFGTNNMWRIHMPADGDGVAIPISTTYGWTVGDNTALNLNLSGANAVGFSIAYYVKSI